MLSLAFTSFLAGILTILAPCVLPVLPVILAGSLSEKEKWYPYIVTLSLAFSVVLFTILLKASTLLIDIPSAFWTSLSGSILLFLGAIYLFPHLWSRIAAILHLSKSNQSLDTAQDIGNPFLRAIVTGAVLGPVFSTCSPTYSLLLATVFPASFFAGVAYVLIYALGLAWMLLIIARGGRVIISRFRGFADERGWFKRILGVIFVLIGLAILTGVDKKIETWLITKFDVSSVEQNILDRFVPPIKQKDMARPISNLSITPVVTKSGKILEPPFPLAIDHPYMAPELTGITEWINSNPLTMKELKGKVVLIDFWTYSCINCQRTLPYLVEWDKKYRDKGLVIIGVHAPEFAFERIRSNVEKAVKNNDIQYPVVLDNNFTLWGAYDNQYWPAKYFIDRDGNIRHYHFGEGAYTESEQVIQYLLGLDATVVSEKVATPFSRSQSPETYLGTEKRENYQLFPTELQKNEWTLSSGGTNSGTSGTLDDSWQQGPEFLLSKKPGGILTFHYQAKDIYLVLGGTGTIQVSTTSKQSQIFGSDVISGTLRVDGDRMYHLIHHDASDESTLTLQFSSGIRAYAFTFGS